MLRLVIYNWHLWFWRGNILVILGFGTLLGINAGRNIFMLNQTESLNLTYWDGILLAILGPTSESPSITEILSWLIIPILSLYLTHSVFVANSSSFGALSISRTPSRVAWFNAKILLLGIICFCFTLYILVGIAFGVVLFLPFTTAGHELLDYLDALSMNTFTLTLWWIILTTSTLFLLSLLQMLLYFVLNKSIYAFTVVIFICVGSFSPKAISIWLPGSQMILRQHSIFAADYSFFTFEWSLLYSVVFAALVYTVGLHLFRTYDFL